ncbi:MAG: hypothetical protein Q8N85_05315 [Candidatus Omnitrophota bacterium]|nr:hypothetical protein [Candidatus Omnitrophota bacterium]
MNKRAVSFLDYALILSISSLALIGMFTYVKRGLQTKVKGITDGLLSSQQEVETITGKRTSTTDTVVGTSSEQKFLAGGATSYTLVGINVINSEATVYDKKALDSHGFTTAKAGSVVAGKQVTLQDYMLQEPLVNANLEELQAEKEQLAAKAQYLLSGAGYAKQESEYALREASLFLDKYQYFPERFLETQPMSVLPEAYAAEHLAGHFTKYWGEYYLGNMAVDITGGTKTTLSGPVVVAEGELKKIRKEIDKLSEEKALRGQADALIEQAMLAEDNDDALTVHNLRARAATIRGQAKLKRQQFYALHKNRLNWKKKNITALEKVDGFNGYSSFAQSMEYYYRVTLAQGIHYDVAYDWFWPYLWRVQFVPCAQDDDTGYYLTNQPLPTARGDLVNNKAPAWQKQAVLQKQVAENIQKRIDYIAKQEKNDAQNGLF